VLWSPHDVVDALRQPREAYKNSDQRPWPPPKGPWVMGQTWSDLLFAHWPVEPDVLRRHIPPQIPLDTFEGSAWIGVTPFVASGVRPRLMLPAPGVSRFPEINVRTYATIDGRPGVYFFSLDTPNPVVNELARRTYHVPYFRSRIAVGRDGARIRYASERTQRDAPPAAITLAYQPHGAVYKAVPDSFEHFAIERYCLYTMDGRERVLRADIHHPPWPLQRAEATIAANGMGDQVGVDLSGEPILHFAHRQDVVFWWPGAV